MIRLTSDDARQLKLFGWFLLVTNGLIVGVGLLFGRALEERGGALVLILAVAVLVNGCFLLVVGGNLVVVLLGQFVRKRERGRVPTGQGPGDDGSA